MVMAVKSTGSGISARHVALAILVFYLATTVAFPLIERRPTLPLGHRHLVLNSSHEEALDHLHDQPVADGVISLHEHPGQQEMVPGLSGQLALPAFVSPPLLVGSLVWLAPLPRRCPVAVFLAPPDKPPI